MKVLQKLKTFLLMGVFSVVMLLFLYICTARHYSEYFHASMVTEDMRSGVRVGTETEADSVPTAERDLEVNASTALHMKQNTESFQRASEPGGKMVSRTELELNIVSMAESEGKIVSGTELELNIVSSAEEAVSNAEEPGLQSSKYQDLFRLHNLMAQKRDLCNISNTSVESAWQAGVLMQLSPHIEKNCRKLIQDDRSEIQRVQSQLKIWNGSETEAEWNLKVTANCRYLEDEFLKDSFYVSKAELDLPLAYIFVVYTNAQQVVRLLKSIYRKHNVYCIHPDARQGEGFAGIFRHISSCIPNIFVASKLERVFYAHHSIMDAQLNCYHDLMRLTVPKWKYTINLCGRELPLKTNRQIVRSLDKLGRNISAVDSYPVRPNDKIIQNRFTTKFVLDEERGLLRPTSNKLAPPPHGIQLHKSFNFIAASKPFIEYILNDHIADDFRRFLRDVRIPEEHFYASLYNHPGVPGTANGRKVPKARIPVVDQYLWLKTHKDRSKCEGKDVHGVCILTVADLDVIQEMGVSNYQSRNYFFFNKYFVEEDHVVMECMEERLLRINKMEYESDCSTNGLKAAQLYH